MTACVLGLFALAGAGAFAIRALWPEPRERAVPGLNPTAAATAIAAQFVTSAAVMRASRLDDLVKASTDSDAAVRRSAAGALGTLLDSPDVRLRRKDAQALSEMDGDAEPAPRALRNVALDPDEAVRNAIRRALEQLNQAAADAKADTTREAVLALAKDLKSRESTKRLKALEQIAAHGAEANIVGEQLIEAMVDATPKVRTAASQALEKVNPKVHPHVFTILFGMRKLAAVEQLAKLGSEAQIAVPLLLHCQANPKLLHDAGSKSNNNINLLPFIEKIAPKDKRLAAAVLAQIAARTDPGEYTTALRRAAAIAHLDVIDAEPAEKVKALATALRDDKATPQSTVSVINALGALGKDAGVALPLLKKLKTSPNDDVRAAATAAIKEIE